MTRIAVPSKGRLRESVLDVLRRAGYNTSAFRGSNASAVIEGIEFIEMRPRDAAAWLCADRLDAAFISTDTALENEIEGLPTVELGFSRSDMVVACRNDAPFTSARDLAGKTVATHLPKWTRRWFDGLGIDVEVVSMGGSLEGICARGMADAIVDLRETGGSLIRNSLHAIEEITPCQAVFTMANADDPEVGAALSAMVLRIEAADNATKRQYCDDVHRWQGSCLGYRNADRNSGYGRARRGGPSRRLFPGRSPNSLRLERSDSQGLGHSYRRTASDSERTRRLSRPC